MLANAATPFCTPGSPLEPNPFFEPYYIIPALNFLSIQTVEFLNLRSGERNIFLAPFILQTSTRGLPIRNLSLWNHPFQFLSTPLVSKQHLDLAFKKFFEWFDNHSVQPPILLLEHINFNGEFYTELVSNLKDQQRPFHQLQIYSRAALFSGLSLDRHLEKQLSSKRRKDLERKRADLDRIGTIRFEVLSEATALDQWLDHFVLIEASGWKGRAGSALGQVPHHLEFFKQACKLSFQNNALRILRMTVGGQPIAMHIALTHGRRAYAIKIAYDDAFSRFSPGALLELENMRRVLDQGEFDFMDSCALPNHELFRRLWSDQVSIGSLAIAANSLSARTFLRTLKLAQKVNQLLR